MDVSKDLTKVNGVIKNGNNWCLSIFKNVLVLWLPLICYDIKYHVGKCSELSSENTAQECLYCFVVRLCFLRISVWDVLSHFFAESLLWLSSSINWSVLRKVFYICNLLNLDMIFSQFGLLLLKMSVQLPLNLTETSSAHLRGLLCLWSTCLNKTV